ncbi:MAG: hypothetical protein M3522_10690 [Actinomycetota bacterium]|nr:hypothetical protein [Actinomycetota bacterium]
MPGAATVNDIMGSPDFGGTQLFSGAEKVLRRNDMGGWTKAAPNLYPHQWSWDSAFIAIGLAHLDTRRAARELETLLPTSGRLARSPT